MTPSLRLVLLHSMLQSKSHEGGLEIDAKKLKKKGVIEALFPLHDSNEVEYLSKNWFPSLTQCRIFQPLDRIKDYFGVKITLYFAFLEYFNISLIIPALVGLAIQIVLQITKKPNHPVLPFYTVIILVWTEMFINGWKKRQEQLVFTWGLLDFEKIGLERVEFKG